MNGQQGILEMLILKAQEGTLSDEERLLLNDLMKSPENQRIYFEIIKINYALVQLELSQYQGHKKDGGAGFDLDFWRQLAREEQEADAVNVPSHKEGTCIIHHVEQQNRLPKQKYNQKNTKKALLTLLTAAAAIVLIFVFAKFSPRETEFKVAIVADSLNAKWADTGYAMETGSPVFTSREKLVLQEGYAQLLFDNNARITLEGPAEFQVVADDQIKLQYGRIYAIVPREAIGFTLASQIAKVIDLGTEFGIEVDAQGDTSLHVIKGRTTLIGGDKSNKVSMEVGAGEAKKISAATSTISDITCNTTLFARELNSRDNWVWKGQKTLDLADIVGGGNGLGTGTIDMGINPLTGKPSAPITHNQASANEYHPVSSNSYIDGVFIPNGRSKQIVSSQGHIFQECPASSGGWYINILSTIRILEPQTTPDLTISGFPAAHCVLMHANMGITYDLEAIRSCSPQANIVRFQSKFGIGKEMDRPCNADFWILVDGKVRCKKQVSEKTLFSVDIELSDKDRFLTLVTTDGQDPEGRTFNNMPLTPYDSDWCFFADPVLILE